MEEATAIDAENDKKYWTNAIILKMTNNRIAFEVHEGNGTKLLGFNRNYRQSLIQYKACTKLSTEKKDIAQTEIR